MTSCRRSDHTSLYDIKRALGCPKPFRYVVSLFTAAQKDMPPLKAIVLGATVKWEWYSECNLSITMVINKKLIEAHRLGRYEDRRNEYTP
jgi:hypothetical protein